MRKTFLRVLLAAAIVALPYSPALAAAAKTPKTKAAASAVTKPPRKQWNFANEGVTFDCDFTRARLNDCTQIGAGEYELIIRPENTPINNSAWFAFKVKSEQPRKVVMRVKVENGSPRYRPKISADGVYWVTLPVESFEQGTRTNSATIRLEIGPEPIWIAAQELVSNEQIDSWSRALERLSFVSRSEIGRSLLGKPMYKLDITSDNPKAGQIVVIGRQHPPETTGTLALMRFIETIVGDSELAQSFRKEFSIMLVPLVNPDGVDLGHWRHNMNGVDLNRDWDNFAQPETRAVRDQALALKDKGRVFLWLDFHSTFNDVFYTQRDEVPTSPPMFNKDWIEAIQKRLPDYKAKRSATPTPTPNTSIFWAHKTFGIPAITYEIGDDTDRALLQQIATVAAEEMMKLMLASKDKK